MEVRRNDKKKSHGQRRITQQWVLKEDDIATAMVCMTGARRGRCFAIITAQSSNPIEDEESDNDTEGHETPVIDEDAPLINKNTGRMDSPVLRAIVYNVLLTTRSLEGSLSPHTGPSKYSVFMARETSAPVNAEEQTEGEDPPENIQDLVK
ncbi:hypothetical protein AAC387_Pa03g1023 [Persea americana]